MNQPLPNPNDTQSMQTYTEGYQYDSIGNILNLIHSANQGSWTRRYAYDEPNPNPTNNRLTSTTVGATKEQPYTYDAHGNMTQMPHLSLMAWDFKDQLLATQQRVANNSPVETTYYVYDAAGQRVRKVTDSKDGSRAKERIYLGGFEIYREYDGGATNVTLERETVHVMDDKRRVVLVETTTIDVSAAPNSLPSTTTRYQFDNHLGSACLELDESAAAISYEEYFPYGGTSYQAGRSLAEVSLKRYRYTGKERDGENAFYYHGVRYYAPWLGRWTSPDPSGPVDGTNLYLYVKNNPLNATDPLGMQGQDPDAGAPVPDASVPITDAGAPITDAGSTDAKRNAPPGGGVSPGEGGFTFYEYTPDPNRIEAQDQAAAGFKAGVVNTVLDQEKEAVKKAVRLPFNVLSPATSLLPVMPHFELDPLLSGVDQRVDRLFDQYKLEVPNSSAGGFSFGLGMMSYYVGENLLFVGTMAMAAGPAEASAMTGEALNMPPESPPSMAGITGSDPNGGS